MVEVHGVRASEGGGIFPVEATCGKLEFGRYPPFRPSPMPTDLLLVSVLRVIVEVAGFALLGQGVLALLAGKHRYNNIFYKILQTVTGPVVKAVRAVTPRFIIDAHIPLVTFFLLFWLWIMLAMAKRYLCGMHGLAC
jgi:hypothetical protein